MATANDKPERHIPWRAFSERERGSGAGGRILSRPGFWRASGKMEHFHVYDRILPVVIHNDTRHDLPGLDDLGIIQPQIKRVGFFVHMQSHNLPFICRAKKILITRFGSTAVLTATRNIRPPNSGTAANGQCQHGHALLAGEKAMRQIPSIVRTPL